MGRFIKYIGSPCSAMRKAQQKQQEQEQQKPIYVPKVGDILVRNSSTNENKVVSYAEWLQLEDSWDIVGLYGITTYEEEDALDGYYVIMSNGTTLIIAPEDFSKVSNNWEHVDTINNSGEEPVVDPIVYPDIDYEYVEIGGLKWAKSNIGTNNPYDSGFYFQWGDIIGFQGENSNSESLSWRNYKYSGDNTGTNITKYNSTDEKVILDIEDDAARTIMKDNWRIPTNEDWETLIQATDAYWTQNYSNSGINGYLFVSKQDSSKSIFIPAVGYCDTTHNGLYESGNNYYWSSSRVTNSDSNAKCIGFTSDAIMNEVGLNRNFGLPIRAVFE